MSTKSTSSVEMKTPPTIYTPDTFKRALRLLYDSERIAIKSGKNFERVAMLLTGAPGCAKTETVKAFAAELDREIKTQGGKGCALQVLRLTQCEITDLKGVPKYIEVNGKAQCQYASPAIFPIEGMPDSANGMDMTIIFFDELQQSIPQMQQLAAAVLDGTIGDNKLDMSRSFVVGCSNRAEDNATVHPLPHNLGNRFMHGTMEVDSRGWITWAQANNLNSTITGFLANETQYLNEQSPKPGKDNKAWATPRSWTKLSQILNAYEESIGDSWVKVCGTGDERTVRNIIVSTVGHSAGTKLMATAKNISESIDVNAIEDGKKPKVPEKQDVQFAVVFELINRTDKYLSFLRAVEESDNDLPKTISKFIDEEMDPKSLTKISNMVSWINEGVSSGKINKSMAAVYRGSNTTSKVKIALQLLGKKDKKLQENLLQQAAIHQEFNKD